MQNKTLKLLGGIFGILVAVTVAQRYAPQLMTARRTAYMEKMETVSADSISDIEISNKDQSVKLTKQDGVWKVNDKKANAEKAQELLDQLIKPVKHELIAETNSRHKELEVTDELATKITLGDAAKLFVGTTSSQGVYVRLDGGDKVFLLSNLASNNLSTDPQEWYDKTIVKLSEETLNTVAITKGREIMKLIKEENVWKLEEPAFAKATASQGKKEVNKEKLQPILTTLSSFVARSIADKEVITKYPKTPSMTVTAEHKDGKETLEMYSAETDSLVKRTSDGEYFIIGDYQAKDFLISQTDLLKPSAQPTPGS